MCCPSRFYLARLSFAWFKGAGNLRLIYLTYSLCLEKYKEFFAGFFPNLSSAYRLSILYHKEKTTSNSQRSMNIWHSTFCQFLKIMKHFNWLSQQMQTHFFFKLFHTVILVRFCQKMEYHKGTFLYDWWYLL